MNVGDADNHLGIGRDWTGAVELVDQFFEGSDGTVGLPVAPDEVGPCSFGGWGAGSGWGGSVAEGGE